MILILAVLLCSIPITLGYYISGMLFVHGSIEAKRHAVAITYVSYWILIFMTGATLEWISSRWPNH